MGRAVSMKVDIGDAESSVCKDGAWIACPWRRMTPKTLNHERMPLASFEYQETEIKTRKRSPYRFLLYLPSLFLALLFLAPQEGIRQIDVPQFFAVGHILREGKIARLYDHDSYRNFIALAGNNSLYYNRPPFHALALLPFGYMSYSTFLLIAKIGSYLLFALAVWLIPRWFPGITHARPLLLCFPPFLYSVAVGQDTILLTLIVGYGAYLILRNKDLAGGVTLALGLFKPHLLWAVPIALAAQRRWRALFGFCGMSLLLAILSLALIGPHGIGQWLEVLKAPTTDIMPEQMGNIRGLSYRIGTVPSLAIAGVAAVAFVVCAWKRSTQVALAAALFVGPLLVPHSYLQDYSPGAIAALLSPYPANSFVVLIPWELFWPEKTISGIPFALTGLVFLCVLAFWPFIEAKSLKVRKSRGIRQNEI